MGRISKVTSNSQEFVSDNVKPYFIVCCAIDLLNKACLLGGLLRVINLTVVTVDPHVCPVMASSEKFYSWNIAEVVISQ